MLFHTRVTNRALLSGALGISWGILWWFASFEKPATHPRISYEERVYIEESLGLADNTVLRVRPRLMFSTVPTFYYNIAHR